MKGAVPTDLNDVAAAVKDVRSYFIALQDEICAYLESQEPEARFSKEEIPYPNGGLGRPRVIAGGKHIEKAAVQFTHSVGEALPPAASERNPAFAGKPFQAAAISLIVHPQNPHVPTTHMNLRFFVIEAEEPAWYFGGGYDLTPFYPVREDVVHWHRTAAEAAGEHYAGLKSRCDEYFYLPHREECRGVGGVFFDDWTEGGFDESFQFVKGIGDSFLAAYSPIFLARKDTPFTPQQKDFQLYRRGRYAEFNLVYDRGTRYGLQSGRRVESVLASMPPAARWQYNFSAEPGTPEAELTDYYLKPRDWLRD